MLKGKIVTIGITSSIAAFKIPALIRKLQKEKATVRCLITPQAEKFVSLTTLECLTGNPVYRDSYKNNQLEHVDLANSTDLFILAPLTANTVSKISLGIADNTFTSIILASRKPILLCPAMNDGMWDNQILKNNLTRLLKLENFCLIKPDNGELACGDKGIGRLASIEKIVLEAQKIFTPQILENKKIIVTTGSTREDIDPVRFISNQSSGKMGHALAKSAYLMGGEVKIIAGKQDLQECLPIETVKVSTTAEMLEKSKEAFLDCDIFISAAAISDFKAETSNKKIKSASSLKIKFKATPDILKELSREKKPEQLLIGFALESEDLEKNARKKLKSKKLDFVIANEIENLNSAEGSCLIIGKEKMEALEKQPKSELAFKIWREIV